MDKIKIGGVTYDFVKEARARLKIRDIRLANTFTDDDGFSLCQEELKDPNRNLYIVGEAWHHRDFIQAKIDIDFFKYKSKKDKEISAEFLFNSGLVHNSFYLVTEIDCQSEKLEWVYVFTPIMKNWYFIGRIKKKDKFGKLVLKKLKKFWNDGANLLEGATDDD